MLWCIAPFRVPSMDKPLLDGFLLDDIVVEPLTGRYAAPGRSGHLAPRAVEVLLRLAAQPRRIVTRQALLDEVWGDGQGSSEALSHAISDIRHALDDHADDPRFVQTVPRRGYRLLVEPVPRTAAPTAAAAAVSTSPDPEPAAGATKPERAWMAMLRHGVVQAGVAYLVFGWLILQIADTTFDNLGLPPWSDRFVTFVVVGGFPIVALLSWFLEMAGGRMVRDRGQQAGGWFRGLERNYLAVVAAYGLAILGAGLYQLTVGFESADESRRPLLMETAEAGYIPVEANSVAVLRFASFDDDPRTAALGAGLSEDVLDRLARLAGLRVASRGDAWSLPQNAPSDLVRRRLRVAYFVEGSVRVAGDDLRVVAQLIDSQNGRHIISRQFERKLANHFQVQEEITKLIVANLRVALPVDETDVPLLGIESVDLDSYVLYRQGMEAMYLPATRDSVGEAIGYFREALRLDAGFAVANAGLCTAYLELYKLEHEVAAMGRATDACAAAVATGGRLPPVYVAVGRLNAAKGDSQPARVAYESALQIDPRYVPAMQGLAYEYERQNDYDAAERLLRQAIDIQPGNWLLHNGLAGMKFDTGKFRDAADEYQHAAYLNPENYVLLSNLGAALILAGDLDTASRVYEKSLELEQNDEAFSNLGIVYYLRGDYAHAAELHRKAVEAAPRSSNSWANLADTLYFAGDKAGAEAAYARALELADAALKVDARNVNEMCAKAWAQAMLGQLAAARETIDRVLRIAPQNPYSHFYDALIRTRQGDLAAAAAAAESALELGFPRSVLQAEPHLAELRRAQEPADFAAAGAE